MSGLWLLSAFSVFAQIWFSETEDGQIWPVYLSTGVGKCAHTIALVNTVFSSEQYTPYHQVVAKRHRSPDKTEKQKINNERKLKTENIVLPLHHHFYMACWEISFPSHVLWYHIACYMASGNSSGKGRGNNNWEILVLLLGWLCGSVFRLIKSIC